MNNNCNITTIFNKTINNSNITTNNYNTTTTNNSNNINTSNNFCPCKPKPVYITQMKATLFCTALSALFRDTQDQVVYIVIPLYHTTGFLLGLNGAIASGNAVVLRKRFSASHFWSDCRTYNVTIALYVGELLRYLLSQPKSELDGVHNLQGIFGNGLRADIWTEVKERFNIPKIYEIYGSTESISGSVNLSGKPGSIGRLSPLLCQLDQNKPSLVKFDPVTTLPLRDANGRCMHAKIGEPGLMITKVPDHLLNVKIYKTGSDATEKKYVRDAFAPGDCYFNCGDAFVTDKDYFLYFYDRLGDTFRWKGENVSTTEVANVISSLSFVEDANVYGVTVPGHDGKAGMAAITINPKVQLDNKELQELYAHIGRELPSYARPLFVRHIPKAALTGTFKNKKFELAAEGFDLNKVRDPLYFIDHENQTYNALTKASLSKVIKSRL
ncbi:very long-chain acyl-CoA synthetase [Elysia marginata]|uniref:long-chain-fatty-acid--CoA ligase n=1 Tax=Elysia marginata TaxID=1093978 RepID=A0AAV4IUA2_9GAST|nr:very long-chain acyl-CoA synthetase [Elysia marginata]